MGVPSMLTRTVRANRSRSAAPGQATGVPSNRQRIPGNRDRAAGRCRRGGANRPDRSVPRAGPRWPRIGSDSIVQPSVEQATARPLHRRQVRLALEVAAQLGRTPNRRSSGNDPTKPAPAGHPGVDLAPRRSAPPARFDAVSMPGTDARRVVGVGHHQVGEVRCAEVRRQPQPHLRMTVVDRRLGDEAEIDDRLVELRVADRAQRGGHRAEQIRTR